MTSPNTIMIDIIILKKIEEAVIKFNAFYGQPPFMIIFNPIFQDRLGDIITIKGLQVFYSRRVDEFEVY